MKYCKIDHEVNDMIDDEIDDIMDDIINHELVMLMMMMMMMMMKKNNISWDSWLGNNNDSSTITRTITLEKEVFGHLRNQYRGLAPPKLCDTPKYGWWSIFLFCLVIAILGLGQPCGAII